MVCVSPQWYNRIRSQSPQYYLTKNKVLKPWELVRLWTSLRIFCLCFEVECYQYIWRRHNYR
jgi:hypothetical protein